MALLARAREIGEHLRSDACCPACLLQLAKEFSADATALEEARHDLHKLWNYCASSLSFPQMDPSWMQTISEDQRIKVLQARGGCALHSASPTSSSDVLHDFIEAVCACLHICLSRGDTSAVQRAENRKRAFKNRGGDWPTDRWDLWPDGAQPGVQSMLFWCATMGTPFPLLLLADMLRVAHPLVFNEIKEDWEPHKKLILAIVRRLGAFGAWANGAASRLHNGNPHLPPVSERCRRANMRAAVLLLESVRDSPDALPNSLIQFVNDNQAKMFDGLQLVLVAVDREEDSDSEQLADTVSSLCASLYAHMPTPDPSRMLCPRILDDLIAYDTLTLFGVLHTVLQILARTRRICSGPDCTRVTHQANSRSDAHFDACARCQIPRYCGKECQREDWKRGSQVPHKVVCPLLCKLLAAAKVEMEAAEFEAAVSNVDWETAELRKLSLFTLNSYRLPIEVLDRAANIHLALLDGDELPDASKRALASVHDARRILQAEKAGVPLSSEVFQFRILD